MSQASNDPNCRGVCRHEFGPGRSGEGPRPPALAHEPRVSIVETEAWEREVAGRLRLVVGYMPLREVGRLTGSNRESVRRYMRRGRVSGVYLARFADAFGVPLEWLMSGGAASPAGAPRGAVPSATPQAVGLLNGAGGSAGAGRAARGRKAANGHRASSRMAAITASGVPSIGQ